MTFKTETQRKPLGLFQRLPTGVSKTHLLPFTGSKLYQQMSSELSTVVWENLRIQLALDKDLWSVGGCRKHTHPPPPPHAHLRRQLQLACPTPCSGMCWSSFREKRTLWRVLLLAGQFGLWSVNSPSPQVFTEQGQTQEPMTVNSADDPLLEIFSLLLWPHACLVWVLPLQPSFQFSLSILSFEL